MTLQAERYDDAWQRLGRWAGFVLDCCKDGVATGKSSSVLANFDNSLSVENYPPGRYFLHWFPFPHVIAKPLDGMRRRSEEELSACVAGMGLLSEGGELLNLMSPFHVLLLLNVYPYCDAYSVGFLYVPGWLRDFLEGRRPDAGIRFFEKPGWRQRIEERQKKAVAILDDWETLGVAGKVRLRPDMSLECLVEGGKARELVEEDILCFHDELACQLHWERHIRKKRRGG